MKRDEKAQRMKRTEEAEVLNGLAQQKCWAVKTKRKNNMRNWHGKRFSLQAQK